jgi:hypothetical protein
VFLINSRLGLFSATSSCSKRQVLHTIEVPLLPKLRGHFAEFLNKGSLARLRFLTLSTCVGLRYGHLLTSLEAFLDSLGSASSLLNFAPHHISEYMEDGFAYLPSYLLERTLPTVRCAYPPVSLHPQTVTGGTGILTSCPLPTLYASA